MTKMTHGKIVCHNVFDLQPNSYLLKSKINLLKIIIMPFLHLHWIHKIFLLKLLMDSGWKIMHERP